MKSGELENGAALPINLATTGRDGKMKVVLITGWVSGGRCVWRRRPRRSKLMMTNWNDETDE